MKSIKLVFVAFAMSLLTACAGNMKMLPDGNYLGMTTVGDTLDRSGSYVARYKKVGNNQDGSPRFEEVKPGDLAVGPTVGGQVVTGVATSVTGAATSGMFAVQAAREASRACREGKCGGSTTFNVQGGSGVAGAFSESNANAGVNAVTGGCSKGGGCK